MKGISIEPKLVIAFAAGAAVVLIASAVLGRHAPPEGTLASNPEVEAVSSARDPARGPDPNVDEAAFRTALAQDMPKWHYQVFQEDGTGRPRYIARISELGSANDLAGISIVDDPQKGLVGYFQVPGVKFNCPDYCMMDMGTASFGDSKLALLPTAGHQDVMQIFNLQAILELAHHNQRISVIVGNVEHDFDLSNFKDEKFKPRDWRSAMDHNGDHEILGRE